LELINVDARLEKYGIEYPSLNILDANSPLKNIIHFQPKMNIHFDNDNGCFFDKCSEEYRKYIKKIKGFIDITTENKCDITVMPEYSFPVGLLKRIIQNKIPRPSWGKIWILGMTGICTEDFNNLAEYAKSRDDTAYIPPKIIFERKYYNTLIYLFLSRKVGETDEKLIIMPQLKTFCLHDMRVQICQQEMKFTYSKTV